MVPDVLGEEVRGCVMPRPNGFQNVAVRGDRAAYCMHILAQVGKPSMGTVYTYCPDCGSVKKNDEPWHTQGKPVWEGTR